MHSEFVPPTYSKMQADEVAAGTHSTRVSPFIAPCHPIFDMVRTNLPHGYRSQWCFSAQVENIYL